MSKERPIIMSTESVRAILAGRKTQTRRVCKYPLEHNVITSTNKDNFKRFLFDKWRPAIYQVGDRLWVKESYRTHKYNDQVNPIQYLVRYKADYADDFTWKNPLFMPREYSRITLELTDVRLEKLQNMTIADAMAEGCPLSKSQAYVYEHHGRDYAAGIYWYMTLWDQLNAKRGFPWKSNPWVWVIEFRRIEKEANDRQMTGK